MPEIEQFKRAGDRFRQRQTIAAERRQAMAVEQHQRGRSVDDIAESLGVGEKRVRAYLLKAGIRLPRRAKAPRNVAKESLYRRMDMLLTQWKRPDGIDDVLAEIKERQAA